MKLISSIYCEGYIPEQDIKNKLSVHLLQNREDEYNWPITVLVTKNLSIYSIIPEGIMQGLLDYWHEHQETGDFLRACLENNLMEAIGRADHMSILVIKEICQFIYMEMPSICHGSPEKVDSWIANGK